MASVNCPASNNVPVLATALGLPVNVSVQLTEPEENVGWLQEDVMPLGRPEMIEALAPEPSVGNASPPVAVAVTVTAAVPIDVIDRFVVFRLRTIPGAWVTFRV